MPNKKAVGIVVACETEDARSLVDTVNDVLAEKIVDRIETRKKEIASTLLGENVADINSGTWEDRYESFDPKLQEAIDVVVEKVEKGEDIDEAIASIEFHDKPKLKEYFNTMVSEDSVAVDSTKETGAKSLKNAERMDDEDVSKRVRYEATAADVMEAIVGVKSVSFDNGDRSVGLSDTQVQAIKKVFDNLNEENQERMIETLTESRCNFIKMVSWCVQATK